MRLSSVFFAVLAVLAAVAAACPSVVRAAPYNTTVLSDSPVLYWRLGESPGAATAVNAATFSGSPASFNGTYGGFGGAGGGQLGQPGLLAGDPDTAALFNGTTSNVLLNITGAPASALKFSSGFTIEAWVKTGTLGATNNTIASTKGNGNGGGYSVGINSSGQLFLAIHGLGGGVGNYSSALAAAGNGGTHHVAVTFNGTNSATFYIDGVAVDTVTKGTNTPIDYSTVTVDTFAIGSLAHGQMGGAPSQFFNGTIDEVAAYGSVLSAAQLQAHFLDGSAPVPEPATVALLGAALAGALWRRRRSAAQRPAAPGTLRYRA